MGVCRALISSSGFSRGRAVKQVDFGSESVLIQWLRELSCMPKYLYSVPDLKYSCKITDSILYLGKNRKAQVLKCASVKK